MGKIINNTDGDERRVVVQLDISELLNMPYYVDPGNDSDGRRLKPDYRGETIHDAVQRAVWRKLCLSAPKVVQASQFKYGFVEETEPGQVQVTFFRDIPNVPTDPGGP